MRWNVLAPAFGTALALLSPLSAARAAQVPSIERSSGCQPEELRHRLAQADSATVARACGVLRQPWAYRGVHGSNHALRAYGERRADARWTRRFARLLLEDAVVDTASEVPGIEFACDDGDSVPIYVVTFTHRRTTTYVVLRFDLGVALAYDNLQPLGFVRMGARADSMWAALRERLDSDPLLARWHAAPAPAGWPTRTERPRRLAVEELPEVIGKVPPEYPADARSNGVEGTVMVEALVGMDGVIQDAVILDGPWALVDAALEAIWQWKFKPAKSDGEPLAVWVSIPVRFSLR